MTNDLDEVNSCSYYLRAGTISRLSRNKLYNSTSSFYPLYRDSVFANISSTYSASGSFLCVGSQSLDTPGGSNLWLNSESDHAKTTTFSGNVNNFKFWSMTISDKETKEHIRNPHSVGVPDPLGNYLFTNNSGSFEKLRLNVERNQVSSSADELGLFTLYDYSQNDIHFAGKGFASDANIVSPKYILYDSLSTDFDMSIAKEKVRIRSFTDIDNLDENMFASVAPIYEVLPSEEVTDDPRFGIEMSLMKGLNENIMTVFSDYSFFENALGKTNLLFSENFPEIEVMRRLYFNNLIEDIDIKRYRELFKWIDNTFTDLMFQLVSYTVKFLGIEFIYESHVLERSKVKYLYDEIYRNALPRDPSRFFDICVDTSIDENINQTFFETKCGIKK